MDAVGEVGGTGTGGGRCAGKGPGFRVEWSTWTGSPDDYTSRLGVFIQRPEITVPEGIQEVTAASVSSLAGDGKKYRVRVRDLY